jgi:beta-galactosidase
VELWKQKCRISGEKQVKRAKWLQEIFHRGPNSSGNCWYGSSKSNYGIRFWSVLDIPGLNYRVLYEEAFSKFPQGFILGSETASTVSSRGFINFLWFKKNEAIQICSLPLMI